MVYTYLDYYFITDAVMKVTKPKVINSRLNKIIQLN